MNITVSTYDKYYELSHLGRKNSILLKRGGVKVLHGVDATRLHKIFRPLSFDKIIFQFPHAGNMKLIKGLNSSYMLVYNFIKSAIKVLKIKGVILITIVDNEYYNNLFKLAEIAQLNNISELNKYIFNIKEYPGYTHTMTSKDKSAIDDYNTFATWEFNL